MIEEELQQDRRYKEARTAWRELCPEWQNAHVSNAWWVSRQCNGGVIYHPEKEPAPFCGYISLQEVKGGPFVRQKKQWFATVREAIKYAKHLEHMEQLGDLSELLLDNGPESEVGE